MAITNKDRITRLMEALEAGLPSFVEQELKGRWGDAWTAKLFSARPLMGKHPNGTPKWDAQALLKTIVDTWQEVFKIPLGHVDRGYVSEMIDARNDWAHSGKNFGSEDTLRYLDTGARLLENVGATEQAEGLRKLHGELLRIVFSEQARQQLRTAQSQLTLAPAAGLKPWREIVVPHPDVQRGDYAQAEFAADLWQVHTGQASTEYRDPREFFGRTFVTEGLRDLLRTAAKRIGGGGGDPIVTLQTNFGGGKTHSMLALYHMLRAADPLSLPGLEDVLRVEGVPTLPKLGGVAVLVGTAFKPGQPDVKPDGTIVRTLWGELAWQLAGKTGYAILEKADVTGTNPGDALATLFRSVSPCLILIDEWVAFVRQLYGKANLPAGDFEANLTFAQTLSEQVKAVPGTLLVASLPASDIEIGGDGGKEALARLQHTFDRTAAQWRPASQDESYGIVRRRLFEAVEGKNHAARDAVIRAFADFYRQAKADFPAECSQPEYQRIMAQTYPLHPELFRQLHDGWGALDRFQRTRGLLRLMATAIHVLWQRDDRSLMITPSTLPLDHAGVEAEMTRYLNPGWPSVISRDIEGEGAIALRLDQDFARFGRVSASRRVARTLFIGSAPTSQDGRNPGLSVPEVTLGAAQPGDEPAVFADALTRMMQRANHLYEDHGRYWFSTAISLARKAEDIANAMKPEDVEADLITRLRANPGRGQFSAVHVCPELSADVPDDTDARLVVLGPAHTHPPSGESLAQKAADEILRNRGPSPRVARNALVFLAPDKREIDSVLSAVRQHLAWTAILRDKDVLNLTQADVRLTEKQVKEWNDTVARRILSCWCTLMIPEQPEPADPALSWQITKLSGDGPLADRASRKLEQMGELVGELGPASLKAQLERVQWGGAAHVTTKQLADWFAQYIWLPRLKSARVLQQTIQKGIDQLINESFGYADRFDAERNRYEGLVLQGGGATVVIDAFSVVVKPEVAKAQKDSEARQKERAAAEAAGLAPAVVTGNPGGLGEVPVVPPAAPSAPVVLRRFYGTVNLNPMRPAIDMGRINDEVLQHLASLIGAKVTLTLDISIEVPDGVPPEKQQIVLENAQTLKFTAKGFARD